MAEHTINLPEELEQIILDEGYDFKSWIHTHAIKPLQDRLKINLQNKELKKVKTKIEKSVKEAGEKVKIVKKTVIKKKASIESKPLVK